MVMQKNITLIDDELDVVEAVSEMLELEGFSVTSFTDPKLGLKSLSLDSKQVVLCDVRMPYLDGLAMLDTIQSRAPKCEVILMSGHGDIPMAIEAMKLGAFDFIEKPLQSDELIEKLDLAVTHIRNVPEAANESQQLPIEEVVIGVSNQMEMVRTQVLALARTGVDTIINGETGTGKEVIASALHQYSKRRDNPFVAINCGGMTESIIESELFGHEAGSFTSANKKRIGKIEQAHGGTLFLDEIESMPIAVQIKLLRVIQERVIERVGGNRLIPVDIVVVAASKADLAELSKQGEFRADLFYRLNIASLNLPPLRQRKEDIQSLFRHFVVQASQKYKTRPSTLYSEQIQQLCRHDWPGNVRELRNVADRFVLGIVGEGFDLQAPPTQGNDAFAFEQQMEQYERNVLTEALIEMSGNINEVSLRLNLPRKTLYRKMKKHQLDKENFKA
ncbi:Two component, sigma54 specific, transcriptional regulator, Fis family protein [Vibrio orientalis CIP 102891 = ATCC 33934]|uniref:Two component sigma54 specific transcriptional regulator Fis family protein n=1 Tax=Vibrio orientalis CIP 102891 = ATCC 33934 TaxID=675816 RepID=C9QFA7_VIBOR|nr:sigma-54 dependent transcriptional regulator [Vibrio orientalis]EEX94875.1 two component sigma54 specific transcriptional regulator Fis family protein [Vibrio orientalis CIP 102891 = ATCC 33934]EGU52993.1 Two component, sigma54 specific, transcriptional regulator, Fis family protein [Vibrio orientalis CIP 102891 = ATCC 33934]